MMVSILRPEEFRILNFEFPPDPSGEEGKRGRGEKGTAHPPIAD
jgi:hypothetical protein